MWEWLDILSSFSVVETKTFLLTLVLLNQDLSSLENNVDPDQMALSMIRICFVFQAGSESTVLIEIIQMN